VYIDGRRKSGDVIKIKQGTIPPKDLQSRHLWSRDFPNWESDCAVSVKAPPYNAKGDGWTDDSEAIQRAINENKVVFLPKGYYSIERTIKLNANTNLIGVGGHLSIIMARKDGKGFKNLKNPMPLVESGNFKNAETVIAFCGLYAPKSVQGAYALKWQSGYRSIVRSLNFIIQPLYGYKHPKSPRNPNRPFVVVTKNGGGKWYNFFMGGYKMQGKRYRHLLIHDIQGPFSIYQCNPEYALSDSNMEICNSKYVNIYGFKSEGNRCVLSIEDSDHIFVFGYGGNAAALENKALFIIRNTPNFLMANTVDFPHLPHKRSSHPGIGRGVDPRDWHIIMEETQGMVYKTIPLERPVLYSRGRPISNY